MNFLLTLTNEIIVNGGSRLGRVDFREPSDIVTVFIADDVVFVRLFRLGQDVGIGSSISFLTIQHPVCFARETSAFAPVCNDSPGTIRVMTDVSAFQEFGRLIAYLLSGKNGCLLVEDTIAFDEIGCSVADTPGIPSSRSLFRLFITDNGTKRCNFGTFNAYQFYLAPSMAIVLLRNSGMSLPVFTRIASFFAPACLWILIVFVMMYDLLKNFCCIRIQVNYTTFYIILQI